MKTQTKLRRITAVLVALTILLELLFSISGSITVFAAHGDLSITGSNGYTYSDGVITISQDGTYTISMSSYGTTTYDNRILVQNGVRANITLNNVSIDRSATENACAFEISGASTVNLTLTGPNTLKSGTNRAGLQVPYSNTLVISGTEADSLNAVGGAYGAGIGGYYDMGHGGTVTINGGTITANGGSYAAGIGGSWCGYNYGGSGGSITISGGTVNATGSNGAGVGGGMGGDGGIINISDGTVTATGGSGGAGIGGGASSSGNNQPAGSGGIINISGGIVTAKGANGAGIGGGGGSSSVSKPNGTGGEITIIGGMVTASAGSGASIGIGRVGTVDGSSIDISGGSVNAANIIPQPKNGSGIEVYRNNITVGNPAVRANTSITAGSVDSTDMNNMPDPSNGVYGIKNVVTGENGMLYFWLPVNESSSAALSVTADGTAYSKTYPRGASALSAVLKGASAITLTPSENMDFGTADVGYSSPPDAQTVAITNTGSQMVDGLAVSISGESASNFTLVGSVPESLAPSDTTNFTVQPKLGLPDGTYKETMSVSGDNITALTFTVTFKVVTNAAPPVIKTDPQSTTVDLNGKGQLNVDAVPPTEGLLSYQWYRSPDNSNWEAVSGAIYSTYSPNTSKAGVTYYYVEVTNKNASVTGTQTASVNSPSASVTVRQKELIFNVTISDKPYDGLNTAAIYSADLIGVEGTDVVNLTNGTAVFANTAVGLNIPIIFTSDFSISGPDADNYTLIQPSGITANITEGFTPVKDTHYTLSEPDGTDGWYAADVFTITAGDGYNVSLGNQDDSEWMDSLVYSDEAADRDVTFYVRNMTTKEISVAKTESYKLDRTAPAGEIELKKHSFKSFLNTISFGLFFKDFVDVNIKGEDDISGIASLEYIKSDIEMDLEDLENAEWSSYGSLSINANEVFILYARITDKAGNAIIINSEGVVVYTDSAQDTENIHYTLTSEEDIIATVKLNGNTVSAIKNGEDTLNLDEDYTLEDKGVITFKAAYLEGLSAKDYTLTISYNPLGHEYVDAEGNEAPADTTISLSVLKAKRNISGLADMTRTYGDASFKLEPGAIENPTFAFESSDMSVAEVDESGKVTINGAGSTTIKVSATATDQYEACEDSFTLTVNKAVLTASTDNVSRKYGEVNPDFAVHISGFVNSEDESALTALPTADCQATQNSEVGKYNIIISGGKSDNYEFRYTGASLIIIADTSALEKAIKEAGKWDEEEGYTPESWQILQDALEKAKNTLTKEEVKQAEVNAAAKAIEEAISGLVHIYQIIVDFDAFTGSGSVNCTINADYKKFEKLLINGKELDTAEYTVTSGSTVITLNEAYLKTLKNGTYPVTAEFVDGSASTTLEVKVKDDALSKDDSKTRSVLSTGDSANVWLWTLILVISLGVVLLIRIKKSSNRTHENK